MCARKVSRVHHDLNDIIKKVAEVKEITDIEYNVIFGFDDVDSFASGIHNVVINGKINGIKVKYKVVLKWHHSAVDRTCFRDAYRREFVFYNCVTPLLLEIQRKSILNEGLKFKFPNCVLSSMEFDKEVIVLHHLKDYKTYNRFHKMDLHHVSLIIKNLAKLHALSFAAAGINPDEFDRIKDSLNRDVQYSDTKKIPKSLVYYFNASLCVVADEEYKDKLRNISRHIAFILNKLSAPISPYSVLCHADCWHNNVLFKYHGDRPVEAIFIDYQLARFASPVTDLSYFFYMCTDYEFLSKNYDQLLDIYYATCAAVLRECYINIDSVYPRQIFVDELRYYSLFGLVEALISMKIITADAVEAQKMTEMKNQLAEVNVDDYEIQHQDVFVERVNGIVNFFFEKNYSLNCGVCE
ncbi:unnamed protein product [Leptosia nina]|uniref:CHK kinase-like domain-containing protein n=1 Tax=Leptosia nina TaxID=320188 RepID=A0AAV1JP66_9NEOP